MIQSRYSGHSLVGLALRQRTIGARAPQAGALPCVCLCEPMQMNWMVVHDINRDLTGKAEALDYPQRFVLNMDLTQIPV
jgi:hypothetical protein